MSVSVTIIEMTVTMIEMTLRPRAQTSQANLSLGDRKEFQREMENIRGRDNKLTPGTGTKGKTKLSFVCRGYGRLLTSGGWSVLVMRRAGKNIFFCVHILAG
jgi:hypothetical protein